MIERKPAYCISDYTDYDVDNRNGDWCKVEDLREVEEQRDRLLKWVLEPISRGPVIHIYGKDWKEFYKEDMKRLEQITGLSWEELKGNV